MYAATRQLPYAPTPYSYTPSNALSATINLDEEVKLSTTPSDRDLLDSLAEIYSIIVALDGLEKAFNKDSVTDAEYTELCTRLLKQYKGNLSDDRVSTEFGDLESFKAKWNVSLEPRGSAPGLTSSFAFDDFQDRMPSGYREDTGWSPSYNDPCDILCASVESINACSFSNFSLDSICYLGHREFYHLL